MISAAFRPSLPRAVAGVFPVRFSMAAASGSSVTMHSLVLSRSACTASFRRFCPIRFCAARRKRTRRAWPSEKRKAQAFLAAGFEVPRIVYGEGPVLVLSDVAPIIQDRLKCLRKENAQEHDELLIHCAHALGKAHAKGLCHGRPHPRDFFQKNGVAGFLDFEEEPEAVMPLAVAQARDVWLLFFQITAQARFSKTPHRALAAYRAAAPADVVPELHRIVGFFDLPSRRSGCFVMSFWVAMDGGFCRRWNFSMQTLMRPANQAKESDNTKRRDVP